MPVSRESSGYSLSEMVWPLHAGSSGVWQPPPRQEPPRDDLKHRSKKAWIEAWRSLLDAIVCRKRENDALPDPGSSPVAHVATASGVVQLELDQLDVLRGDAASAVAKPAVRPEVVAVGA